MIQRVGPFFKPLFRELSVFSLSALGEAIEIPPPTIGLTADHNQLDALSGLQRQWGFRFQQTFLVPSRNKSHGAQDTTRSEAPTRAWRSSATIRKAGPSSRQGESFKTQPDLIPTATF